MRDIKTIFPSDKSARTHKKGQIGSIIKAVGFNSAIMVDGKARILAGHACYQAALLLSMTHIPVIVLDDLSEAQKKPFRSGIGCLSNP